ncbi:MAG TPA: hypothetical protein VH092_37290 [Urbifossiella sp.]|jgi:hypothetical protein|nr:hypothetical protein [Urbifossiella sp.]
MTQFGSPEQWIGFIESQVPAIVALVIDTWEGMPAPPGNELEDTVSEALCRLLRQSRNRCDLPFRIDTQLVELDPAAGQDQGRMDIVFSPAVPREDIYFCLECKRLNVREAEGVRPYFSEYVRFGIFRFVRGQYARSVRFGGMLAFVLDGDVAGAMTGVEGNIRANCSDLGMAAPGGFRASAARPADGRVRETEHRRGTDPDPFMIQHLFMAGDPATPLRPPPPPPAVKPKKKKARGTPHGKQASKRKR